MDYNLISQIKKNMQFFMSFQIKHPICVEVRKPKIRFWMTLKQSIQFG